MLTKWTSPDDETRSGIKTAIAIRNIGCRIFTRYSIRVPSPKNDIVFPRLLDTVAPAENAFRQMFRYIPQNF